MNRLLAFALLFVLAIGSALLADPPAPRTPKEALRPFGDLIGSWRGTGVPVVPPGSRSEFWSETIAWEWQFKGKDAWLKASFDKSKNFTSGELRYVPEKDNFTFSVRTPAKEMLTYTGTLKERVLTLEREQDGDVHRLVFTMLHPERHLYRYEVRPAGKALFAKKYNVGATKEGVAFAGPDGKPECVVSGGLGTMTVSYMGKTYYVCCSGCRAEFNEDPAKYVAEFEARKAKKAK
jgi:hypothetical protein